jgi:hypothetical protein
VGKQARLRRYEEFGRWQYWEVGEESFIRNLVKAYGTVVEM